MNKISRPYLKAIPLCPKYSQTIFINLIHCVNAANCQNGRNNKFPTNQMSTSHVIVPDDLVSYIIVPNVYFPFLPNFVQFVIFVIYIIRGQISRTHYKSFMISHMLLHLISVFFSNDVIFSYLD